MLNIRYEVYKEHRSTSKTRASPKGTDSRLAFEISNDKPDSKDRQQAKLGCLTRLREDFSFSEDCLAPNSDVTLSHIKFFHLLPVFLLAHVHLVFSEQSSRQCILRSWPVTCMKCLSSRLCFEQPANQQQALAHWHSHSGT